jgi:hypothetical protein
VSSEEDGEVFDTFLKLTTTTLILSVLPHSNALLTRIFAEDSKSSIALTKETCNYQKKLIVEIKKQSKKRILHFLCGEENRIQTIPFVDWKISRRTYRLLICENVPQTITCKN